MAIADDDTGQELATVVGLLGVPNGGSGRNKSTDGPGVVVQDSAGAALTTTPSISTYISANSLALDRLVNAPAYSVLANATGSTGARTNVTAAANHYFFYRRSNALAWVKHPTVYITPTGVDQTAEVQAAVDSSTLGVHVEIGEGNLLITNTISITKHGVTIGGQNKRGSQVYFTPPSDGAALFHFQHTAATSIKNCGVWNLAIRSTNTSLQKIAIKLTDYSQFIIDNVEIGDSSQWTGNNSIGVQTFGREYLHMSRCLVYADLPVSIEKNPNQLTIDFDHSVIERCTLYSINNLNPVIKAADGVHFSMSTFKELSFVRGTHGFYYVDTLTAGYSQQIEFSNIRWEQATGGTGYMIYFVAGYGARNMTLARLHCGSGTNVNGFYIRNVEGVTIASCEVLGSLEALNCDGTVRHVWLANTFFQANTTMTMTDLRRVFAMGRHTESNSPAHGFELWLSVTENTNIADGVTLTDSSFNIVDEGDATKKQRFQISSHTTGTVRTLTTPDYDGTIATLAGSEALTNKTYQGSTIQTSGNVGIGVAPSGVAGEMITAQRDANAVTTIQATNADAVSAGAIARLRASASTAVIQAAAYGAGVTASVFGVTIGNWSSLNNAGVGNGLLVGTINATPVRIGSNSAAGIIIDGTNPHPSFPASHKRVTVQYDNTTTTLGAVTGLTVNVTAAKSYAFRAILHTTSDVGGGVKCAIAGTCTATAIIYDAAVYYGGQTVGTTNQRGTALGTTVGQVTAVVTAKIIVDGIITVANAGTLLPQLACNVAVGTTSALVGSEWFVWEIQ